MEGTGYQRYGLMGNPFRELASETIEAIELLHVNQTLDRDISTMLEEAREKVNKSVVLMMGGHGMGKTERLMLIQQEARKKGDFCVYLNVSAECDSTIQNICEGINECYKKLKKKKLLTPKWMARVIFLAKKSKNARSPERAGQLIAEALNNLAPSFLLLNDLQSLKDANEADCFNSVMNSLLNGIRPGVVIVLTCEVDYFNDVICSECPGEAKTFNDSLSKRNALKDRINRRLTIPPLSKNEAMLVIGKRLLVKRLVDDLPSLYPFTDTAVERMNHAVQGNPRMLLKLADHIIDAAVKARAVQVDEEFVDAAMESYSEPLIIDSTDEIQNVS